MGQLKALLPWQGDTLLGSQVSCLLQAGTHQVIVVLGHQKDSLLPLLEGRDRVVPVLNPDYRTGKTTSIKAGIKAVLGSHQAADAQTLVLLNVDQPRTAETITTLLSKHASSDCLITIPVFQGKRGHPLILDCSLLPELLEIAEASQGIRAVVRKHEDSYSAGGNGRPGGPVGLEHSRAVSGSRNPIAQQRQHEGGQVCSLPSISG